MTMTTLDIVTSLSLATEDDIDKEKKKRKIKEEVRDYEETELEI